MTKESKYKILGDSIEFQYYDLFFSSLHKNAVLNLDRINAIDLNSSPYSLIIDKKEIVFFNHKDSNSIEDFAVKNKVPLSTHFDTWAILTRDYLNTQFDKQTLISQNEKLAAIGIDPNEYRRISKGLWWTLFGTMELSYIGLWDVLAIKQYRNPFYRFYGESFYWRMMSIGLMGSEYKQ